ncbi:MAG TPA: histidine kinase [Gemmatimonadaceae bacterium]|nr:histidine kinase [Gemmatimonadaceae bacterium]
MRPDSGDDARALLELHRSSAERLLNGVRALVLLLLATAAVAYRPTLPPALNRVNVVVLIPTLGWTAAQWIWFRDRETLPGWLAVVNPVVDITAVTAIMGGYGLADSPELAFRSPVLLAYFAVLASRPITSSSRKAAAAALLVVVEYGILLAAFLASGRTHLVSSPLAVVTGPGISMLDEGAKLLLLAVAGGIATYATAWHERLLTTHLRQTRHREQLEARLVRAQLERLKLQLHPHFLFNTLNTITALLATDTRAAERVITGLSELLRVSLHSAGEQEVPLERELELLRRYVEIQEVRFPDRLRVELFIDPEARRALVPNLILQPLVENAIRHGIAPRAAGGRVEVSARREGDRLLLRVLDDGVGSGTTAPNEGVGLGNTRERLRHLYGDAHEFAAGDAGAGGFDVRIAIPFRAPVCAAGAFAGVA